MCHGIHSRVGGQLLRHGLSQGRVNDCHIRRDVEICKRIFDSLAVISDDGKCGYFRGSAGGGRNRTEFCLGAQGWEVKRYD